MTERHEESHRDSGDRSSSAVLLERARSLASSGARGEAWALAVEVAERARAEGDVESIARAALTARLNFEDPARLIVHALAREGLARLPDDAIVLRARLAAQLSATEDRWSVDDWPSEAAAAFAEAERVGDPEAVLAALQGLRGALGAPSNIDSWFELGTRAIDHGARTGMWEAVAWGRLSRIDALWVGGRRVDLENEYGLLAGELGARADARTKWQLGMIRACLLLNDGNFDDARRRADAATAVALDVGLEEAAFFGHVFRSHAIAYTGLVDEKDEAVETVIREWIDRGAFLAHAWLAEYLTIAERHEEASASWALVRAHLHEVPMHTPEWLIGLVGEVSVCTAQRDEESARWIYTQLLPFATCQAIGSCVTPSIGPVSYHLAVLAEFLGDDVSAIDHAAHALVSARSMAAAPFEGRSHVVLARLTHRQGASHHIEARAHAEAAREIADRLAWPRLRVMADAAMPQSRSTGLTPREFEIAGLVAAGESNRGIATALFLSERTVETHVRHILQKLGLSSRVAVAAWYLDHR